MANIDIGKIDIKAAPTELTQLLTNIEGRVKPLLNPGVHLVLVPGAEEYTVMTDAHRVSQVLINLLTNACKYTTKGAISFGYEIYDNEVNFTVRDTGVGLEPAKKSAISDFLEADGPAPATGMGLQIARAITRALNGQIGVESRGPGRGATFWFTIPNDSLDNGVPEESEGAPVEEPAFYGNYEKTLLIAEDRNDNYMLYTALLGNQYNLVRAMDGVEAVELFKKINPDLVIMDLMMPNMGGEEATKEIRKLSQTVPIIAATAYAFAGNQQKMLQSGFNGYIAKPINPARLDREIKRFIQ